MMRRLVVLGLVLVAACSSGQPKQRSTPRASASSLPAAIRPSQSIAPLSPGEACPRPRGKTLHRSFGLAFGDGPVYVVLSGAPQETGVGLVRYGEGADDGNGHAVSVIFVWDSRYNGPVFVRGSRIDGPGTVRFQAEAPAAASGSEVAFPKGEAIDRSGWHMWGAQARFKVAGCYAFQIDGNNFSRILRFEAQP